MNGLLPLVTADLEVSLATLTSPKVVGMEDRTEKSPDAYGALFQCNPPLFSQTAKEKRHFFISEEMFVFPTGKEESEIVDRYPFNDVAHVSKSEISNGLIKEKDVLKKDWPVFTADHISDLSNRPSHETPPICLGFIALRLLK